MSTRILLISGEPSGDYYARRLIEAIYKLYPSATIYAWGGTETESTKATQLKSHSELAEMGFTSIIKSPIKYASIIQEAKSHLTKYQINHFIGVDYSGLNLKIASHAKKMGIKTTQFIAPKTWAYASFRNTSIKKSIDQLIAIFPFEVDYFTNKGITCHYVGNPLVGTVERDPTILESYDFGLFPGSRAQEIKDVLPVMLDVIKYQQKSSIIGASAPQFELIQSIVKTHPAAHHVTITTDYQRAMQQSKKCLCTSGTITLEAALMDKWQLILYKTNVLNYWIGKALIHIPYIGLPNILSEQMVVPEFIQASCRADKMNEYIQNFSNMKMNYTILSSKLNYEDEVPIMERIAEICLKK